MIDDSLIGLAGYLLMKANINNAVDDKEVLEALTRGQEALHKSLQRLSGLRGNVKDDIAATGGESVVAMTIQRMAADLLIRAVAPEYADTGRRPPDLTVDGIRMLRECWPTDFMAQLQEHFPEKEAASFAVQFITRIVAAVEFKAGNCGEHAAMAAHELCSAETPPAAVRIPLVKWGLDHSWAEALKNAGGLSNNDVILDGWLRTPAHIREDSVFASRVTETRGEFVSQDDKAWLTGVVRHMSAKARENGILAAIHSFAASGFRARFQQDGAPEVDMIPIALRPALIEQVEKACDPEAAVLAETWAYSHAHSALDPATLPAMADIEAAVARKSLAMADIEAAGVARTLGVSPGKAGNPAVVGAIKDARATLLARDTALGPRQR